MTGGEGARGGTQNTGPGPETEHANEVTACGHPRCGPWVVVIQSLNGT